MQAAPFHCALALKEQALPGLLACCLSVVFCILFHLRCSDSQVHRIQ